MKKILSIAVMVFLGAASCFAQKFGIVNSTELVQLCPAADEARKTLQVSSTEAEGTYKEMADEINKKYETYQQKASTWTPAIRESKEKELNEMQQRIQEFGNNIRQELAQQEQTLFAPIAEKVSKTIENIAKAKGLAAVFEVTSLPYVDKTLCVDITPEARKAMGIAEDRTMEKLQAEIQAQQQQQAAK